MVQEASDNRGNLRIKPHFSVAASPFFLPFFKIEVYFFLIRWYLSVQADLVQMKKNDMSYVSYFYARDQQMVCFVGK